MQFWLRTEKISILTFAKKSESDKFSDKYYEHFGIMKYINYYASPLGKILLAANDKGLSGLWLEGEKAFPNLKNSEYVLTDLPVFNETRRWLDVYFAGYEPNFLPPLDMQGTLFQREVWDILLEIPYGKTMTYGEIAKIIAEKRGIARMSAQAVGQAVGRNPISVIVPCHRVIGADGSLTGYAGGIARKEALLRIEGILK